MVFGIMGKDVLQFAQLFAVFLVAFATAFVSIYRYNPDKFGTLFQAVEFSFASAFNLEDSELSIVYDGGDYYSAVKWAFWAWVLLVNVVLLNILIAMMTSTYEQIKSNVRQQWRVERTRFIHEIATDVKHVGN